MDPATGGGSVSKSDGAKTAYATGDTVTVIAEPLTTHNFTGWRAGTATTIVSTQSSYKITINSDTTLTAVFTVKQIVVPGDSVTLTVSVSQSGGGTVSPSGTKKYAKNEEATVTATASNGYEFTGWSGASTATTASVTITMDDDKELTANFASVAAAVCTLKVIVDPPGYGTVQVFTAVNGWSNLPDSKLVFRSAGDTAILKAVANPEKEFLGWSETGLSGDSVLITMNSSIELTVYFGDKGADIYRLSVGVSPAGAGKVEVTGDTKCGNNNNIYCPRDVVTLNAISTLSGYEFSHWTGDLTGSQNPAEIIMNKDYNIVARFEREGDVEKPKLINIDTASYKIDSDAMTVSVTFSHGDNVKDYSFTYELMLGSDTAANSDKPATATANPHTLEFKVVDKIRFDTTYTIYLRVVDADEEISSTELFPIAVGAFEVQPVVNVGFRADNKEAIVDNGRFILDTKEWVNERSEVQGATFKVVVEEAPPPSSDDFIMLSKDYKYIGQSSSILYFSETAFNIKIKLEKDRVDIPAPYDESDVRLYRYIDKQWEVVFGTVYEGGYVSGKGYPVPQDTGSYRLMINKKMPTVSIGGASLISASGKRTGDFKPLRNSRPIEPGSAATVDNIRIQSNIANTKAEVKYMVAKVPGGYGDTLRLLETSPMTDASPVTISISPDKIVSTTNESGVFVYLIINNGTISDTINMSRQMGIRNFLSGTDGKRTVDYKTRWSPLAARVDVPDLTIDKAFDYEEFKKTLFDEEELAEGLPLDDKRYRLFRWLPKTQGAGDWTEYMGENKQLFQMVNGRLMWLRTTPLRGNPKFVFDTATTTSLVDTFTVYDTLKSKQWTDLIMPFDFDVKVKDVLAATSGYAGNGNLEQSDSLYFYTWEQDGTNKYTAKELYLWHAADTADASFMGPFTVYNNYARNIVLRIPPKPAVFQSKTGQSKTKAAAKAAYSGGFWYYAVNAVLDDMSNVASLRLGYYESERVVPAPPTLGSQSVVILSEDGWHIGNYLTPELSKGGRTFKLRFINGEKQKATFRFSAQASAGVPEKMQMMFVDAVTGEILGGSGSERSLTVAGNSHSDVYAVVGGKDYLNKTVAGPSGAKFAMGGISVNQSARSVRLKYYVPLAGTDRVEVSVYNLKGRLIWKNAEKVRLSSWNTMEWRSRESRGGAAAAGLYIIRVRAMNVTGKTTAIESRRITFAR
jgi:uncharacterized repeat protein (TIGR02543 family)